MTRPVQRTLEFYADPQGKRPCEDWLESLQESVRLRILRRLDRIELGNFGDCEPVGEGVHELRFFFGPGYRLYIGQVRKTVVFLCGGTKKTQTRDIQRAQQFWKDYRKAP